jgi:hypothetical protein
LIDDLAALNLLQTLSRPAACTAAVTRPCQGYKSDLAPADQAALFEAGYRDNGFRKEAQGLFPAPLFYSSFCNWPVSYSEKSWLSKQMFTLG